ncbi:LytTR family DNA-binding domain-containing protein [Sphingoaurantiacus capsulatus]|uniref:LytTR family DNA-binding domain-containing protein n=1 Tax=Sphingoaurantiacus capsulatus TaxID=1771310 RepID=A0ABV7XEZ4_9SPHN
MQIAATRPIEPTPALWWAAAAAATWSTYVLIFLLTTTESPGWALQAALANTAPLLALAIGTRQLLRALPVTRPSLQALRHLLFAMCFALFWYGGTLLMIAALRGLAGRGFEIVAFHPTAFAWQSFQSVALYALIAVTAGRPAREGRAPTPAEPKRYFLSAGKSIRPVSESEIVSIAGAKGYSEVVTVQGERCLSRVSLDSFESDLGARFLRLHRSILVNPAHLVRLEPAAGGRMTALLASGETVPVSRSGAGLVRALMV